MYKILTILVITLLLGTTANAGIFTPGGGGGLPTGGNVNDCVINTSPGTGTWQVCPGAAGGDSVSVNGVAVVDPNFATAGSELTLTNTANVITFTLKSGLTITSPSLVTPALGTPASGVGTNLTGIPFTGLTGAATDAQVPNNITIDLAAAATALAANGGNCTGNNFALGVDAAGVAECAQPAFTNISGSVTDAQVPDTITASSYLPLAGGTMTGLLTTDNLGVEFDEGDVNPTCAAGNYNIFADLSEAKLKKCTNGVASDLDTTGAGIGGTVGTTDNAIPRADGTGGSTLQASGCTINDSDKLTCTGGFAAGTSGVGVLTMLEGTAPGAGAAAGEHNVYFDSTDSLLKSHENAGSVVTYATTGGNIATATALAANGGNCSGNDFALGVSASGVGECAQPAFSNLSGAATDAQIPDTITASSYLPLAGGTLTGQLVADNLGIEFDESDTNPTCAAGNFTIYADASENKLKKCINGSATDLDTTGGTPSFDTITGGTNTTAAMIVGTGGSLVPSGTGTINASALAANGANCSAGSYPLGVDTAGASESCTSTATDTVTFTNKTLDAEATGNVLTIPKRIWLPAAGCNNTSAGPVWDLPTTSPAVAACVTGTNTQKGVLDFADAVNLSAQITYKLPSTWSGAVDLNVKWFSSTITGDVVWQSQTICVADAETDDPAFNTADAFTADTTKGTANQMNDASDTGITMTGCAAGELLHLKIFRDSTHASDTMVGTARLIGVELVMREAI